MLRVLFLERKDRLMLETKMEAESADYFLNPLNQICSTSIIMQQKCIYSSKNDKLLN